MKREGAALTNVGTFNTPEVASYYAGLNYLTPCEALLFDRYLTSGMAILDLGVGGGRTTPHLSAVAASYVGADYAEEMVLACRSKFSNLRFEVVDAADLSMFAASSFDAVVMAFNTMDNVIPDENRYRALKELARVLKPNGILIFSSHNIRALFPRPSWNQRRLSGFAENLVGRRSILYGPLLWSLTVVRALMACARALLSSIGRLATRLPTRGFWKGEGYVTGIEHRGTMIHESTPKNVERELARFAFRRLRVLGDDYPKVSRLWVTEWYYYVFSKNGALSDA